MTHRKPEAEPIVSTPLIEAQIPGGYLPDNVSVHFHHVVHQVAEQLDTYREIAASSDIIMVEVPGWDAKKAQAFKAVSKGDRKAYERFSALQTSPGSAFRQSLLDIIRGTYKPVLFVDADKQEYKAQKLDLKTPDADLNKVARSDYRGTIQDYGAVIARIGEKVKGRDQIMLDRIGPSVTQAVEGHPKLRNKEEVVVSMAIGAVHNCVYECLADSPNTKDQIRGSTDMRADFLAYPEFAITDRYLHTGNISQQALMGLLIVKGLEKALPPYPQLLTQQLGAATLSFFEHAAKLVTREIEDGGSDELFVLANKVVLGTSTGHQKVAFLEGFYRIMDSMDGSITRNSI